MAGVARTLMETVMAITMLNWPCLVRSLIQLKRNGFGTLQLFMESVPMPMAVALSVMMVIVLCPCPFSCIVDAVDCSALILIFTCWKYTGYFDQLKSRIGTGTVCL